MKDSLLKNRARKEANMKKKKEEKEAELKKKRKEEENDLAFMLISMYTRHHAKAGQLEITYITHVFHSHDF